MVPRILRVFFKSKKVLGLFVVFLFLFYTLSLINFEIQISWKGSHLQFGSITRPTASSPKIAEIARSEKPANEISVVQEIKATCMCREHRLFPHCWDKYMFLRVAWRNPCFERTHGIDGTDCSIFRYLTEVEPFCMPVTEHGSKSPSNEQATVMLDLQGVLDMLPLPLFSWMRDRITRLWPDWVQAAREFKSSRISWVKKKVLVYLGSFDFQKALLQFAGRGGPLGELVQWSDTLAALYVLGYDVRHVLNATSFKAFLDYDDPVTTCANNSHTKHVDAIYTDYNGFLLLGNELGYGSTAQYRCAYRIVDSFGTEPAFNSPGFAENVLGHKGTIVGGINLLPEQFLTLFPHSPDNSFLGFVVGSGSDLPNSSKSDRALVYGKLSNYLKGHEQYLQVISEYFEIHATISDVYNFEGLPGYIKNHGMVSGDEVKRLLLQSKLFIGLGFPYEGPGPIEAMAAGAVFLQPKFDRPHNRENTDFFKGKPTLRKVTSQSPYMEDFVGEPYSFTIDIQNVTLLRTTLQKIKEMKPLPPKIPKEFTNAGMLERVYAFTDRLNLCEHTAARWPPIKNMQVFLAETGESCVDLCRRKDLICERSYMEIVNSRSSLERYGAACSSIKAVRHVHPPSIDPVTGACFLQESAMLFSCAHSSVNHRRLCTCRDFEQEQVALCRNCL